MCKIEYVHGKIVSVWFKEENYTFCDLISTSTKIKSVLFFKKGPFHYVHLRTWQNGYVHEKRATYMKKGLRTWKKGYVHLNVRSYHVIISSDYNAGILLVDLSPPSLQVLWRPIS